MELPEVDDDWHTNMADRMYDDDLELTRKSSRYFQTSREWLARIQPESIKAELKIMLSTSQFFMGHTSLDYRPDNAVTMNISYTKMEGGNVRSEPKLYVFCGGRRDGKTIYAKNLALDHGVRNFSVPTLTIDSSKVSEHYMSRYALTDRNIPLPQGPLSDETIAKVNAYFRQFNMQPRGYSNVVYKPFIGSRFQEEGVDKSYRLAFKDFKTYLGYYDPTEGMQSLADILDLADSKPALGIIKQVFNNPGIADFQGIKDAIATKTLNPQAFSQEGQLSSSSFLNYLDVALGSGVITDERQYGIDLIGDMVTHDFLCLRHRLRSASTDSKILTMINMYPKHAINLVLNERIGFVSGTREEKERSRLGHKAGVQFFLEEADSIMPSKGDSYTSKLAENLGSKEGKAQPMDAKILTPLGWKTMGEIKLGDMVFGYDGQKHKVVGIFPQSKQKIYKLTFADKSSTECTEDHLWAVKTKRTRWRNKPLMVMNLKEMTEYHLRGNLHQAEFYVPRNAPIEFEQNQELPINPYILGILLGDGSFTHYSPRFTTSSEEILESMNKYVLEDGNMKIVKDKTHKYDYAINNKIKGPHTKTELRNKLEKLGLWGLYSTGKFIPEIYKMSKIESRLAILQGLFDTDGTVSKKSNRFEYSTSSQKLKDDVVFIARSLGCRVTVTQRVPKYGYKGIKKNGEVNYRVKISFSTKFAPFRLSRKLKRYVPSHRFFRFNKLIKIEYVGIKEAQCIKIDSEDGLYLTDDFIVTHNTGAHVIAVVQDLSNLATEFLDQCDGVFTSQVNIRGNEQFFRSQLEGTYSDNAIDRMMGKLKMEMPRQVRNSLGFPVSAFRFFDMHTKVFGPRVFPRPPLCAPKIV